MNAGASGDSVDLEGFAVIGGGGGATCERCGSYVWQDERSLSMHREWHVELERRTKPMTAAARDRLLGQHLE